VPAQFEKILEALESAGARYVVVGGLAAVTYGSPYLTDDFDIAYERSSTNLDAIVRALAPLQPRLRTKTEDVPIVWDARTLKNGLNFTLATDAGDVDLLGEISGVGSYADVAADSVVVPLYGFQVQIINLDKLIASKRAAGRAKDLLHVDALEEIKKRTK
jgi:predicted nucleotidyltransferase